MQKSNIQPKGIMKTKKTVVAFVLLPLCSLLSQMNSNQPFPTTQMGPNLYKIEVDVNSIIASVGPDGVLLCDVGGESKGPRIMATVSKLEGEKIKYIINTHWHVDHTGGNICFGKEAIIIAHENVRKRLAEDKYLKFWDEEHPAFPEYALPDLTFSDRLMLHFNGEDVELIHLPGGHTDGDAIVYFRNANILHAGDCLFSNGFPAIDFETGGSVEGFADNLKKIASMMPSDVRIVTGHGPDYTIEELLAYEKMVRSSLHTIRNAMQKGLSVEAMQEAHLLKECKEYGRGFFSCDEWINMIYQSLIDQSNLNSKTSNQQPVLKGLYLGQKPPGMTPEVFAPGIVSTGNYERALVFAPDGNGAFFHIRGRGYRMYIIHLQKVNGYWSKPEMAFFSGVTGYDDGYPFFSPDGERLYFTSKRPIEDDGEIREEGDIWVIEKSNGAWGLPCWLGSTINSEMYEGVPSVSSNGNLYFNSNRGSETGDWGIFVSRFSNGKYTKPEKLPPPIDSETFDGHPFIAPDESFLLFDSNRQGGYGDVDIYVSFHNNGVWSEAINLGDKINTPSHEVAPYVSPDGKYLFFTTFKLNPENYTGKRFDYKGLKKMLASPGNGRGDIYWVDAKIIKELKPKELK